MSALMKSAKDKKIGAKSKGQLTVNLALFFLALLASEDCVISSPYPPLGSKTATTRASSKSVSKSAFKSSKSSKPHRSQHYQPAQTSSIATPTSVFWISDESIQWTVIEADIQFYLPGASVKRARNKSGAEPMAIILLPKSRRMISLTSYLV
jgi:hypothetical protein